MMMAMTHVNASCCCFLSPTTKTTTTTTSSSYLHKRRLNTGGVGVGGGGAPCLNGNATSTTQNSFFFSANFSNKRRSSIPILRSTTSSNSDDGPNPDDASAHTKKPSSFGYSRKDVILIGVGLTLLGIALKTGLEFAGVDPLQAGNVVQLVLVLGLTVGWISTYIFRVSNKEMTYAQQLRNYESKVMEKRLESLTEAELEVLLQEVEEEKSR